MLTAQRQICLQGNRSFKPACKRTSDGSSRSAVGVRVVAEEAPEKLSGVKEGSRIRVSRSLPIYHSPKFKEGLDLEGKEGEVLSDVSQFKGKTLSSTLPYKVQFMVPHGEAGEVKVIAHLNGTEFEPL
ncbi:hypothetical protein WJX84_005565 [Apatococcus fuscideae]|uniref:Ferredoxin thioredoxin reductase alpha chain domain-containing protein n=1 Tax=Apatococcus fuscideae TaxID=2026836 RepID=A0AAW1T4U1_9CHLO